MAFPVPKTRVAGDQGGGRSKRRELQKRRGNSRSARSEGLEAAGSNDGGEQERRRLASGLVRTPLSGGVHSATEAHDLPPPPVAVRNLMEQAEHAHLATVMSRMHHRRAGFPFCSLVQYAVDRGGHPVFPMSPLAIHTRNLEQDPRASLVVEMPGWSGEANARVTLFGHVHLLPEHMQAPAQEVFRDKANGRVYGEGWGNFNFWRMNTISDVYFIGTFGTVQWVDVAAYKGASPDSIVSGDIHSVLNELNQRFASSIRPLFDDRADDSSIVSIDRRGADVRLRRGADHTMERLRFSRDVFCLDDAVSQLNDILLQSGFRPPFSVA